MGLWRNLLLYFGLARLPDGHPAAAETEGRMARLRETGAIAVAGLLLGGLIAALADGRIGLAVVLGLCLALALAVVARLRR